MTNLQDAKGARRRLAWVHASVAEDIAKTLEADPDATITTDVGLANVAAWEAFCKADRDYRNLKTKILMKEVPHVERAGEVPTLEQNEAINAYAKRHPERMVPGTLFTVSLANEAIDWFNSTGGMSD